MGYKNTQDSYGVVSKFFHWAIALLILGVIIVGLYMTSISYSPEKLELYARHKSFGLVVLWLAGLRILWLIITRPPKAHSDHQGWERILAKLAHVFLYVAMIGMPLSGWLMSSAGDYPVPFFGIQMPDLIGKNPSAAGFFHDVHEIIGYLLIAVIGLHAAGALKHHFFDADDTLERMMPKKLHGLGAYVIVIILGIFLIGVLKFASFEKFLPQSKTEAVKEITTIEFSSSNTPSTLNYNWKIIPDQSQLSFKASVYGKEFTGIFHSFNGDIIFDPNNLKTNLADITININSIDSDDGNRDSQMLGADWFFVENYPTARFKTRTFEDMGEGKYLAVGDLTIRDQSLPISFPFQLDIVEREENGTRAFMEGTLELDRLDFGLGQGSWEATDIVNSDVRILIKLVAEPQ